MAPTTVTFTYDEVAQKWEATVSHVITPTEARQAFSAVVLTCRQLNPALLIHTKTTKIYDHLGVEQHRIVPAV